MPKIPKNTPRSVLAAAFIGTAVTALLLALLGAAVLNLLGARYLSKSALVGFMLAVILLGLPLSPVATRLEKHLVASQIPGGRLVYLFLDTGSTFLLMLVADAVMATVTIPLAAAFATSLLFSLLELFLTTRKLPNAPSDGDRNS